jgi:hypothetical protein
MKRIEKQNVLIIEDLLRASFFLKEGFIKNWFIKWIMWI